MNPNNLKMYVLIKDTCPTDLVPLIAAHLPSLTHLEFREDPTTVRWFYNPLQKLAVCKVTPEQFEQAKTYGKFFALTEVNRPHLGELGLGFAVRETYPKFFKFLPLWKF